MMYMCTLEHKMHKAAAVGAQAYESESVYMCVKHVYELTWAISQKAYGGVCVKRALHQVVKDPHTLFCAGELVALK